MNENKNKIIDKLPLIKQSPLFKDLTDSEINKFLESNDYQFQTYEKGEKIVLSGDNVNGFGIILSGQILYYRDDFWGNRNILLGIKAPNSFGEAFVYADVDIFSVNVMAMEKTQVLFLSCNQIYTCCDNEDHSYRHRFIQNMLRVLAEKYISMVYRLNHVMKRSLREKLLSYLSEQSETLGNKVFEIPFSRQELADYLSADRSALSAELSRMQTDGILTFHKNHFELLENSNKINDI